MGEPQGKALTGRTVGFIGLGGIAKALIKRLKTFGVRLIGIKRNPIDTTARELGLEWIGGPGEISRMLQQSDFVMLCLPVNHETMHLINHETISCMKKDAFLINLSRGGLIQRDALKEALASGRIAGAGLDVFWEEPPDPDDDIFN